ncbi:MAG: hypothetical protein GWP03_03645 [Proteobacteria bacterium]|nr:hypothetical protein [Pseudomonadota bacterium]
MKNTYVISKYVSFIVILILIIVLFIPNIAIILGYIEGMRSAREMDVARHSIYNYFIYYNKLPNSLSNVDISLRDAFGKHEFIYIKTSDSSYVLIDKVNDIDKTGYNNKYKMIGIYFDARERYNDIVWNDFFIKEKGFLPALFNE